MTKRLTPKETLYAELVVSNGGDKVKAYEGAGYSMKMSMAAIAVQADKIYNKPKVNLKITTLQSIADKVAEEAFEITIEQRLRWLKDVADAGLRIQAISKGEDVVEQCENLPAVTGAIKVMNEMLGTDPKAEDAKPVKVFIGVEDAS